jgi:uncharacterized protein YkwD
VRLARLALPVVVTTALLATASSASSGALSARERAADAMIERINEVRARQGLRQLRASSSLRGSSRRFAIRLMSRDALYHRARPSVAGRYRRAGEVLAMHFGRRDRVRATVARWMRSSSHRAVIMTRSMGELGAGVVHGRFRGRRAVIWVVQAAAR